MDYEVLKYDKNSDYPYIVISKSYINAIGSSQLIAFNLKQENYNGLVLFDSLLSNGFASNRFVTIYFDGEKFDYKSVKVVNQLPSELHRFLYDYYATIPAGLKNSVLPDAQQYLLLNKLIMN